MIKLYIVFAGGAAIYIPKAIQAQEDYQACIRFHGHTCTGVTIGYLAAKLGMQLLGEQRSADEELIVIVETDACCCDAIQVVTGCTFGKGNFFYRDYGKMAFTFASRVTGRGVRLVLKPDIFVVSGRERKLSAEIGSGQSSVAARIEYEKMYEARGEQLFAGGPEAFFDIEWVDGLVLPPKAPRAPSKPCSLCGEMVMQTKLSDVGGHMICRACQE